MVGYSMKPFDGKHKRQHLQFVSPHIDFVVGVLERQEPVDFGAFLAPELGLNCVDTPCTEVGSLGIALEHRQRVASHNRPWRIADRHARGFRASLKELYATMSVIAKDLHPEKPDWRQRYMKYDGAKREHYRRCALEQEANPIGPRRGPGKIDIFHEGAVKWGEISARPRALLVQSVRAKGCDEVKPGTVLRSPIMIEGGYRDPFEDALHKYTHRRGFHFVASGMDLHRRGREIRKMIEPGDMVLSCDWTSFDGSLGWLAVWEREEFLHQCERVWGRDDALRRVIESQNDCKIQAGPLKGRIFGNRGSGTAGTSTGNKMVVLAALRYALGPAMRGAGGVKLFCDGDDTLIIVPRRYQPTAEKDWVRSWVRRLSELGLETKVEQQIFDSPAAPACDHVRFCRAGVVDTSRGPFLCKKPLDALKVMTNIRRHFRGPRFMDYLQTLSVGCGDVYGDVPVLCALTDMFDVGGRKSQDLLDGAGMEYMISRHKSGKAGLIENNHRVSFFATWGVPPDDQIRCENALRAFGRELRELVRRPFCEALSLIHI